MNRSRFYAELRKRNSGAFGTSLTQSQVEGCEAVLDECMVQGASLYATAYILATAYGESNHTMQPQQENLWYSSKRIPQVFSTHRRQGIPPSKLARNPEMLANIVYGGEWGREVLGNTEPRDGWRFRGTGTGQITGRYNFGKWGKKLNLPLLDQPELLMQLDISTKALVRPMLEGWATGKKLPSYVNTKEQDYVNARRVWNGVFDAEKYASWAKTFEDALKAAEYRSSIVREDESAPIKPDWIEPDSMTPDPKTPWWISLIKALASLFGKGKS